MATKRKSNHESKIYWIVSDTWKCILVLLSAKNVAQFYSTSKRTIDLIHFVFPCSLPHSYNTRTRVVNTTWINEFRKLQIRTLLSNPDALFNFILKNNLLIMKPYNFAVFVIFLNKFKEFTAQSFHPTLLFSSLVSITNPIFLFQINALPHGDFPTFAVANNKIWFKKKQVKNIFEYPKEIKDFIENVTWQSYIKRVFRRASLYTFDAKTNTLVVYSNGTTGYYREIKEPEIKKKLTKLNDLHFIIHSVQHIENFYLDFIRCQQFVHYGSRDFLIAHLENAKLNLKIPNCSVDELKFVKHVPNFSQIK